MCISVPAMVLSRSGLQLEVEVSGIRRKVFYAGDDIPEAGEWVLLHGGLALGKVDPQFAEQSKSLLRRLSKEVDG